MWAALILGLVFHICDTSSTACSHDNASELFSLQTLANSYKLSNYPFKALDILKLMFLIMQL